MVALLTGLRTGYLWPKGINIDRLTPISVREETTPYKYIVIVDHPKTVRLAQYRIENKMLVSFSVHYEYFNIESVRVSIRLLANSLFSL